MKWYWEGVSTIKIRCSLKRLTMEKIEAYFSPDYTFKFCRKAFMAIKVPVLPTPAEQCTKALFADMC